MVASLNAFIGKNQRFDFTIADIDRMNLVFNKAAQISSLMSDYIPILTFMLVSGSIYAMVSFAKGMTATLSDQHGAKVMASGNFDAGNVRVNTYQQEALSVASFGVGSMSWGNYSWGNISGNNTGLGNESMQTINKPMRVAGMQGQVVGAKAEDGGVLINSFSGSGVSLRGWKKDNYGFLSPTGDASASFSDGQKFMNFLGYTSGDFRDRVMGLLSKYGIEEDEVVKAHLQQGQNGLQMTIVKSDGSVWNLTAGDKGSAGTIDVSKTQIGVSNGEIVSVGGLAVTTGKDIVYSTLAQEEKYISYVENDIMKNSQNWSFGEKVLKTAAYNLYKEGQISARELYNLWRATERVANNFDTNLKGSASAGGKAEKSRGNKYENDLTNLPRNPLIKSMLSQVTKALPSLFKKSPEH